MREWAGRRTEHSGAIQRLVRARRSLDVELIARRAVERLALVGTDLRLDVERAQQTERTACNGRAGEIEVDVDVAASAEVDAARDVEEPGELGEAVAVRLRRDRGELFAQIVRERQPETPRARAGAACTRRRRSHMSRGRRPRRRGGTARTGR